MTKTKTKVEMTPHECVITVKWSDNYKGDGVIPSQNLRRAICNYLQLPPGSSAISVVLDGKSLSHKRKGRAPKARW